MREKEREPRNVERIGVRTCRKKKNQEMRKEKDNMREERKRVKKGKKKKETIRVKRMGNLEI